MNTARLNPGIPLLLNGVTKRYGDNTILNELDLHIPSGQFVAVVGRSGGGKSTLLRLLAGLETPNAGELLAGATPLAAIQDDTRMMFQDARLLPWKTVIDNVGLGLKGAWREAALQALASVGLESRAGVAGGAVGRAKAARCAGPRPDPSPAPAIAGRAAGGAGRPHPSGDAGADRLPVAGAWLYGPAGDPRRQRSGGDGRPGAVN